MIFVLIIIADPIDCMWLFQNLALGTVFTCLYKARGMTLSLALCCMR